MDLFGPEPDFAALCALHGLLGRRADRQAQDIRRRFLRALARGEKGRWRWSIRSRSTGELSELLTAARSSLPLPMGEEQTEVASPIRCNPTFLITGSAGSAERNFTNSTAAAFSYGRCRPSRRIDDIDAGSCGSAPRNRCRGSATAP